MPVPARLDVVAAPVVNHAMAHNGIRVLHRVTVSLPPEPAAASLRDLRLSARLVDDQGHPLTLPWSHQIDQLDSGDQVVLDDPPLRLDAAAMAGLTEATQGDLSVTLTGAGEPVVRVHAAVRVLAARQWLVDPDAPLRLRLVREDGGVRVANTRQPRRSAEPGAGLGLRNLAARCAALGLPPPRVEQTEGEFRVWLGLARETQR